MLVTGASCTSKVKAAVLSAVVPDVNTIFTHAVSDFLCFSLPACYNNNRFNNSSIIIEQSHKCNYSSDTHTADACQFHGTATAEQSTAFSLSYQL